MRMRKIISGKLYDTEEAKALISYSNGLSKRDFGYVRETLYKANNGDLFLHGRGGAKTQYSERVENGRSGGSTLKLYSQKQALEWLEQRELVNDRVLDELDIDEA